MTDVRAPKQFALSEAIAVLNKAGLVRTVLLPGTDGLSSCEPASAGAQVTASFAGARLDSRRLAAGELFVALQGEHVHGRKFAGAWLARGGWVLTDCLSGEDPLQGTPADDGAGVLLCPDPQAALATLARTWRELMPAKIIGVTGTNGKTTTKDLLAAILAGAGPTWATSGNFNNFLGLPLTLLGLRDSHRFAVIEMGASAVGEIDYLAGLAQPEVGIITNAAEAHLAEFGSLDGIIQGKGELLDHLPAEGTAILNADSPGWQRWCERARCPVVSFGRATGDHHWSCGVAEAATTLTLGETIWPVPLPGVHNAANLAAAILAARAVGVGDAEIRAGLRSFSGSPHRGIVFEIGGRTVLDDAYNANPASMLAAGQALLGLRNDVADGIESRTFAVLGHMAELGTEAVAIHRQTGERLAAAGLDFLVAVGEVARPLSEGFDGGDSGSHYCASVAEAADWLAAHTRTGDCILVKGSRSAAMERIFPLLIAACGADHETQD